MSRQIVGTTIEGKFKLLSLLGEGGLGTVYKAEQVELNRMAAVKFINEEADPENQQRFEREARILASLTNEHVVRIYSFGKLENESPYIAMELVEGITLQQQLQGGPLPWKRCAEIGIEICNGLEAAHTAGIVHRDLKPQNIMLANAPHRESGQLVKILDFGLSKVSVSGNAAELQRLTQTGALIGSVHYMSPEICRGQQADTRSDIYALGCILYQCLTGHPPFDCDNPVGLLHKHSSEAPARIDESSLNGAPPQLELVILKAIQKSPEERFQTATAMAEALRLIASGRAHELDVSDIEKSVRKTNSSRNNIVIIAVFLALAGMAVAGGSVFLSKQYGPSKTMTAMARSERQKNIDNASRIIAEAREKPLGTQDKLRLIQKVIRLIGHRYPSHLITSEYAMEDSKILSQLKTLSNGLRTPNNEELTKVLEQIVANDAQFMSENSEFGEALAKMDVLFGFPPDGMNVLLEHFVRAQSKNDLKNADYFLRKAWEYCDEITNPTLRGASRIRIYEYEVPYLTSLRRFDEAKAKALDWTKQVDRVHPRGNIYRSRVMQRAYYGQESLNMTEEAKETLASVVQNLRRDLAVSASPNLWTGRLNSPSTTEEEVLSYLTEMQEKTMNPVLKQILDEEITSFVLGTWDERTGTKHKTKLLQWAYKHMLGRRPSQSEIKRYLEDSAGRPLTLLPLLRGISRSDEFKKHITAMSPKNRLAYLYQQLLGRKPDPIGTEAFLPKLQKGDNDSVIELIVLSGEFTALAETIDKSEQAARKAQLAWMCKRALGRYPSDSEVEAFLKQHKDEAISFAQEMQKLATSNAFIEKLNTLPSPEEKVKFLYKHSLGREEDRAGLEIDSKKVLSTGAGSREESVLLNLYAGMLASEEFKKQLQVLPFAKGCKDLQ